MEPQRPHHKTPRILDTKIMLRDYEEPIRQLVIAGLGKRLQFVFG